MEDHSSHQAQGGTTDAASETEQAGNIAVAEHPTSVASPLTQEELEAFRAEIAQMRAAMKEAQERFERAKVVSQAALAFEVSLVF